MDGVVLLFYFRLLHFRLIQGCMFCRFSRVSSTRSFTWVDQEAPLYAV